MRVKILLQIYRKFSMIRPDGIYFKVFVLGLFSRMAYLAQLRGILVSLNVLSVDRILEGAVGIL